MIQLFHVYKSFGADHHALIVFRGPFDPAQGVQRVFDETQQNLAKDGFSHFQEGEAKFGARTIRTLDLGGDKIAPGFALAAEANPILGWRAIRYCLARPEIFRVQLRALLRAAGDHRAAR